MSIETWYTQIEEAPDDWELRLQFADWLEENGEPVLAAGQRWQVEHKRSPSLRRVPVGAMYWIWKRGTLPQELFERMALHPARIDDWVYYGTIQSAERDLALSLKESA